MGNILLLVLVTIVAYFPYKIKNFNNTSKYYDLFVTLIFFFSSLALLIIGHGKIYANTDINFMLVFGLTSLVWFMSPILVRKLGKHPNVELIKESKTDKWSLLTFSPKFLFVKYFEVVFQQTIFLFIFFVILNRFTTFHQILLFSLIIPVIHLGNIFFMSLKHTMFYFLLSIPMSILFAMLISNGRVLVTASIHLLFYLSYNSYYWLPKKKWS